MQEVIKLLIGGGVLALGILIGNFLARKTKEELKAGKKWFKLIIAISLTGGATALIFGNDTLMFSFFFIAIVTSKSLVKTKKQNKIKNKKLSLYDYFFFFLPFFLAILTPSFK